MLDDRHWSDEKDEEDLLHHSRRLHRLRRLLLRLRPPRCLRRLLRLHPPEGSPHIYRCLVSKVERRL